MQKQVALKPGETIEDLQNGYAIIQDPAYFAFGTVAVLLSDFADIRGARRAVDLGTGCGIIPILLCAKKPDIRVVGIEIQEALCDMALRSVALNKLEDRVCIVCGNIKDAHDIAGYGVDAVVCNPPYIPLDAWESVATEARDHDPHLALFSGDDGLDAMRALEGTARRLLRPGGWVGAEHADAQGEAAPAVFAATGFWRDVRDHRDLAGRDRYLTARLAR